MTEEPRRPTIAERIANGTFGEKKKAHGASGGRDAAPANLSADEAISWHQRQAQKGPKKPRSR